MSLREKQEMREAKALAMLCENIIFSAESDDGSNGNGVALITMMQNPAGPEFYQVLDVLLAVVKRSKTRKEAVDLLAASNGPDARTAFLALDWTLKGKKGVRPAIRHPKSTAVSVGWVLNRLAGGSYPEQGQAYDFIREAICDYEELDEEQQKETTERTRYVQSD